MRSPLLLLSLLYVVHTRRYLMFGVNPNEGFNLRCDVYIRAVSLVKRLQDDWVLVLTPWPRMHHWRSRVSQDHVPWSRFFDIASLNKYLPVIEFSQYMKETGGADIDMIYFLQHYEEQWDFQGGWKAKHEIEKCRGHIPYTITPTKVVQLGYMGLFGSEVSAKRLQCITVQGMSVEIKEIVAGSDHKSVYVDRFERLLHTDFRSERFWQIRRSMVYSLDLQREALIYIGDNMWRHNPNITDLNYYDKMIWGPPQYIAAHIRRGDFAANSPDLVPSLKGAAAKITALQSELGLQTVFIATDATQEEKEELSSLISPRPLFYTPSPTIQSKGDGAVAIIEQLIAGHATYFIGTCESTFSYRIHESRMIKVIYLPDSTYNCFCNENNPKCKQPVRWHL